MPNSNKQPTWILIQACIDILLLIPTEVAKLQTHLNLLREEYVKLQKQLADVNLKYQVALAAAGSTNEDNFVSRLLKTVSNLYNNQLYR